MKPGGWEIFRAFVAEGIETDNWRDVPTGYDRGGWLARRDGSRLDLLEVREIALAGDLPIATALRVKTDLGELRIAVDSVKMIDASTVRHAALNGFIVGLAADAIIVATAVSRNTRTESTGCQPTSTPGW